MAIGPVPMENDSQFRIAATEGIREPRTRILKHGDTFAVLNNFGDMTAEPGSPDGLYHQDTRFLSQLELRLNGHRPLLLSSTPARTILCSRSTSPIPTVLVLTALRCIAS